MLRSATMLLVLETCKIPGKTNDLMGETPCKYISSTAVFVQTLRWHGNFCLLPSSNPQNPCSIGKQGLKDYIFLHYHLLTNYPDQNHEVSDLHPCH